MTNRSLGLTLMIGGSVIAVVGLAGWVSARDEEPATSTTALTTSATVETSTTTSSITTTFAPTTLSTTVPTTTTTTIRAGPAIEAFVDAFTDAIAREDTEFLLETLHPAVISLFDTESCRAFITEEILQLEQYRLIGEVDGPTRQVIADTTLDMYRAPAAFAFQGQEFTSDAAFAFVDGDVRWFTQCGELPGSSG